MKKTLLFALAIVLSLSLNINVQASVEQVLSFHSEINLNTDSSYDITETISYDFGNSSSHGIYREIPYKYKRNGSNYNVRLSVQNVVNEKHIPYQYSVSKSGGNVSIKIGDPDKYVSGKLTYIISYNVVRGINYFEDQDELYFNITGNEWIVPIENATTTISLPKSISEQEIKATCYTGIKGSNESDCSYKKTNNNITFSTKQNLLVGEGLTIVVGIPKGILIPPSFLQNILWFIQDNWIVFIPFLIFFFMLYRWFKYGKDPETGKHIAPMYNAPKEMSPAEVGVIVDEHADNKDISASFINLAIKGYIKIKEIEMKKAFLFKDKDYEFIKLKEVDNNLKPFEKTLLKDIFESNKTRKLSSLKNKFYLTLKEVKKDLYTSLTNEKYFPTNPEKVRWIYYGIGMGFLFLVPIVASLMESVPALLSLIISGIIIAVFGKIMPRKTAKGVDTYIHILGLKLYLSRAEKKQIDFFNAPEKKPEVFEKLLPYAMVLGVETAWAKEFEDMYKEPPNWYEGRMNGFNTFYLIRALDDFSNVANSTIASTPSSSAGSGGSGFSGGFSGGGFGGGGGGSW